jgi:integrase
MYRFVVTDCSISDRRLTACRYLETEGRRAEMTELTRVPFLREGSHRVEWGLIEEIPPIGKLLPVRRSSARFHDFDEYERLVKTARASDWRALLVVLLGGEAGLRCGEMMALEWTDVDFTQRQLCVQRSEWKGRVTMPKGGRLRYVPLTQSLCESLQANHHLRGPRVLCHDDGTGLTQRQVQGLVLRAARSAGLTNRGVHTLRHSFCSHLAMQGAPATAIQHLAGHQDLVTTQRYMHLSQSAVERAIRLLDQRPSADSRGDILETERRGAEMTG